MQEEFKTSLNYIVSSRLTYLGLHETLPQKNQKQFFKKWKTENVGAAF